MASAISTSALVSISSPEGRQRLADIRAVMNRVPDKLFLKIFEHLSFKELDQFCDPQIACIYPRWRQIIGDFSEESKNSLWRESNLKERFPLLKNIFNEYSWPQEITANLTDVSFEGFSYNPKSAVAALRDIHRLQVEGNAGYTIITMPKGITINKVMACIAKLAAQGKFPTKAGQVHPGFRDFWGRISTDLGEIATLQSYAFAISNSVFQGSRNRSYAAQRSSVRAEGCELPQVIEVITLLFLTYIASGERQERLYGAAPSWEFTRCLELINGYDPLVVGGFAPSGLCGYNSCFDDDGDGAGVARKFF